MGPLEVRTRDSQKERGNQLCDGGIFLWILRISLFCRFLYLYCFPQIDGEISPETCQLFKWDEQETIIQAPGRSAFQQNRSELISWEKCPFSPLQVCNKAWCALKSQGFITLLSIEFILA